MLGPETLHPWTLRGGKVAAKTAAGPWPANRSKLLGLGLSRRIFGVWGLGSIGFQVEINYHNGYIKQLKRFLWYANLV